MLCFNVSSFVTVFIIIIMDIMFYLLCYIIIIMTSDEISIFYIDIPANTKHFL